LLSIFFDEVNREQPRTAGSAPIMDTNENRSTTTETNYQLRRERHEKHGDQQNWCVNERIGQEQENPAFLYIGGHTHDWNGFCILWDMVYQMAFGRRSTSHVCG
jgi:hypothetical protein